MHHSIEAIPSELSELAIFARTLDILPLPTCIVRVDCDEQQQPCDFTPIYCNQKMIAVEGLEPERLGHKFFSELFPEYSSRELLSAVVDAALYGKAIELQIESPASQRYFQITGFQVAYGYCTLVLHDISFLQELQEQVEEEKRRLQILLEDSIDAAFRYDIDRQALVNPQETLSRFPSLPAEVPNFPYGLVDYGILQEKDLPIILSLLRQLAAGEEHFVAEVEFSLQRNNQYRWYEIRCMAYVSNVTQRRTVLGIARDIHKSVLERQALEREASYDPLTQVMNVRAGRKKIRSLIASGTYTSSAFLLFDLDDFKAINDYYGHGVGDRVLCRFAQLLTEVFPAPNIVFRLGGDEFAVFIPNGQEEYVEERLRYFFGALKSITILPTVLCSSVGYALGVPPMMTLENLYHHADMALYEAKSKGKDCWARTAL